MSTGRFIRNVVCCLLLLAVVITTLVLLHAPGYVYPVLVLSLLGISCLSRIRDRLPFIWLLLHVACIVLRNYIEAPWVETVQTVVNLLLPGAVALLAAYFRSFV